MANALKDKEANLNPGDADANRRFGNSGEHDRNPDLSDLQRQEEAGNLENAFNAPSAGDPTEQAKENEEAPSWNADGVTSNNASNQAKGTGKVRKGPIGMIIGIILAASGIVGLGFGAFAIEPIWLIQSIFSNSTLNSRSTVTTKLSDRILYDKFEANVTDGVCGQKITILCKYSRPSNYQLKKMEEKGYQAVDRAGKSVRTLGAFPNKRPDFIIYTDSHNVVQKVPANKIRAQMRLDPKFNGDMLKIYNPRWASAADAAVTKIKKLFGYNGRDKYKNVPADELDDTLNKVSAGEDLGVKGATTEDAQQSLIRKLFGDEIEKSLAKLGQSGKGDAIGLAAGAVCVATDIPGVAIKVARTYQMAQIIRYGAVFMAAAGALQAGDGDTAEATQLGNQLNDKDSSGYSATDSFGVQSYLSPSVTTPSYTSYQKFIPGFAIAAALGSVSAVLSSQAKNDACRAVSNPVTGAAINTALAPETLGILTLVNVVAGIAAGAALQGLAGPLADLVVKAIPPTVYTSVLGFFLGDLTSNLVGRPAGDALGSAFENITSQTCSASGCTPLTVAGAVAFTKDAQAVDLAYAQQDRATHSPLDVTNPNTALGSLVSQFMPYYGQMGSVTGVLSMLGSLTTDSFNSLISVKLNAADPSLRFTQCPLQGGIIPKENATLGFCSLYYGIDPQYLDSPDPNVSDPLTVATNLVNTGQIDEYTGEPTNSTDAVTSATNAIFGADPDDQSTYASWVALCTDGSLDHVSECTSTDDKQAAFSVYMNSTFVRAGMDGEDPALTGDDSSDTSTDTTTAYSSQAQMYLSMLDEFNTPQPTFIASGVSSVQTENQVAALQPATITSKFLMMASPISVGFGVMA